MAKTGSLREALRAVLLATNAADRYQAAAQTVGQWLQDGRFAAIWPPLQQIQGRLSRILNGTMR